MVRPFLSTKTCNKTTHCIRLSRYAWDLLPFYPTLCGLIIGLSTEVF